MLLVFKDPEGELITEAEISDETFDLLVEAAELEGVDVEKYIMDQIVEVSKSIVGTKS